MIKKSTLLKSVPFVIMLSVFTALGFFLGGSAAGASTFFIVIGFWYLPRLLLDWLIWLGEKIQEAERKEATNDQP